MTLGNGYSINLPPWIRFAVQIGVFLVCAAIVYVRLDARVANVEQLAADNRERVKTIDALGTHKSHETDIGQQVQIDDLTRRMNNHDAIMEALLPKVERIDTNMMLLMSQFNKKQ